MTKTKLNQIQKTSIKLVCLFFVFSNCQTKEFNLQGNWILKYKYSDTFIDSFPQKLVYCFDHDQLAIENFHTGGHEIIKRKFKHDQNNIITTFGNEVDTFYIQSISNKEIDFYKDGNHLVLEKLNGANDDINKDKLITKLRDNPFTMSFLDTLKFDFRENGVVINNSIKIDFPISPQYYIDEFYGELFIRFPNSTGPMLQVLSIEDSLIKTKYYSKNNKFVTFQEVTEISQIDESDYYGTWEEIPEIDSYTQRWLSIIPKQDQTKKDFYKKETLIISKDRIAKYSLSTVEERQWSLSKFKTIFIFNQPWKREDKIQWNVKRISKNDLVIERKLRKLTSGNRIETITYKRLK